MMGLDIKQGVSYLYQFYVMMGLDINTRRQLYLCHFYAMMGLDINTGCQLPTAIFIMKSIYVS